MKWNRRLIHLTVMMISTWSNFFAVKKDAPVAWPASASRKLTPRPGQDDNVGDIALSRLSALLACRAQNVTLEL